MGEQSKPTRAPSGSRDQDHYDENVEELLKEYKYLYKEEAKYDIIQALHNFQDLHPKVERCAHTKGGRTEELITLRGTVPIEFKSSTYNIPVQIYTLRTHPKQAPVVFVKPLKNMVIRESKNVDKSGLVYLRYLVDWKSPRSHTLALCKLLSRTFSEECPVFTEDRSKKEIKASSSTKTKKKSRKFKTLRRFSLRSKSPSIKHEPGEVEQPGKSILAETAAIDAQQHSATSTTSTLQSVDKEGNLSSSDRKQQDTEHLPIPESPSLNSTSDSSISKGSGKNVSFSDEATMDDIPDMIYDESLDSLYSSSFESLYSERSVTILAALKSQKIAPNSVFNSSFESLLSEKSISYLLDLEKQWARPITNNYNTRNRSGGGATGADSPASVHSARSDRQQRTIRPRRSLSMNKKEALRRLSQMSIDSDNWPTPPSTVNGIGDEGNLTRQSTFDSDGWPEPPPSDGRESAASSDWPEPPVEILPPPEYPMMISSARDRALSDLEESPFENVLSPTKEKTLLPLMEMKQKRWTREAKNDFTFNENSEYKLDQSYDSDDEFELKSLDQKLLSIERSDDYAQFNGTIDKRKQNDTNRSDYEFNSLDRKFQKNGIFKHDSNESDGRSISSKSSGRLEYESKETQYESSKEFASTETQYNTWDKPDKQLLDALREGRTEYLTENNIADYLDENNITPTPTRKFDYDKPVCNGGADLFKLDFTDEITADQCNISSRESTPRQLTIAKGGMVKRAEPAENKKRRWPFRRKNSDKITQQQKVDDSKCDHSKQNKSWSSSHDRKKDELKDKKYDVEGSPHTNNHYQTNNEIEHRVNRSKSMEEGNKRRDSLYEHVNNNNNNNNNHSNHDGMTNGIYERVNMTMTNGHKHRDCISEAKIYEPISFSNNVQRAKSDNHLTCRYKSVGCLAHSESESDSLNHNDEAVSHHMYLLLNKVEYLTGEVKSLKHKIKTLESES